MKRFKVMNKEYNDSETSATATEQHGTLYKEYTASLADIREHLASMAPIRIIRSAATVGAATIVKKSRYGRFGNNGFTLKLSGPTTKRLGKEKVALLSNVMSSEYDGMLANLTESLLNELSEMKTKFLSKVQEEYGKVGVAACEDSMPTVLTEIAAMFLKQTADAVIADIDIAFNKAPVSKQTAK